jgi:riboflavin synthase
MFTGIIETLGTIARVLPDGQNCHFEVASPLSGSLKVDQSVSHDGACLTVTRVEGGAHWVTAVDETLRRTACSGWNQGARINIERAMPASGRFDGHIVQGHVDAVLTLLRKSDAGGSWLMDFGPVGDHAGLLVEKGSVAVNGVSLTCFEVSHESFRVAVIPHTLEKTNLGSLQPGEPVNIEFDILGKYVARLMGRT